MAVLNFDFDEADYEDFGYLGVLKPGDYNFVITGSEFVDNKAGNGKNLVFEFTEMERGIMIKEYLPVVNQNEVAQKIARQKLATIQRASGLKQKLTDSNLLHGREICLTIEVEEREWQGKKRNSNIIKQYKKKQSAIKSKDVEMDNLDMIF